MLYANFLEKGMYLGLVILFITYALYVFGIMDPYIPLADLSKHWSHNVGTYLHDTGIKPGWAWLKMLGYGDFINFIGVAVLSGVTILCYLAIIPREPAG
jgi:hypothetical protein